MDLVRSSSEGEDESGGELIEMQSAIALTLRLLLIARTNFSVFALRVLAYTNFSDFLCLHNVIMSAKPSAEFICRHWMQALHHALSHI